MEIRLANEEDCSALLDIYAQYMETPITFEYTLPSQEEFAARIRDILRCYPYLVCQEGTQILGYAYGHRYKERAAYQWGTELSIYLDKAHTAQGLGKALYQTLMELLRAQGVRTAYGCVTMPNERSERLHTGLGFRKIGIFRDAGYKCGQWHDVAWFEKALISTDAAPTPVTPLSSLPADYVRSVLRTALSPEKKPTSL